MRILHISSAQAFGGGERHLVDLVKGLSARSHDLFVALRPKSPLIAELTCLPQSNFLELSLRNAVDARSAARLSQFVAAQKIEIVHAHMARDYPTAAYAARRNRAAHLIITRHVLFPLSRLHKFTLSHAARVIAVSKAVARQLADQKLIHPEKINVVHNGVDFSRFDSAIDRFDRNQFRRDWDLPEEGPLVGSVGELNPLKGHQDFLQAATQIARLFPKAYFIVAGIDVSPTQTNLSALKQSIQKLQLSTRVRLIGRMTDITELFRALDVFVSASHTESFGLAIAEAMAAETPVVATKTEGAQEIIRDGKTGLLVPIGDVPALAESVTMLLRDEERRLSMAEIASEDVRMRFSLQQMVETTEKIYFEVRGEKPST
ncbi:MAG TPA: glycosyltransferase family 4 protein [Pyrinomonadaceae bacterium]|nr:glycosyltransferase family 4 protein [Pyrinomonadaceae bacterium]